MEPVSPALAVFLTPGPPGKSAGLFLKVALFFSLQRPYIFQDRLYGLCGL